MKTQEALIQVEPNVIASLLSILMKAREFGGGGHAMCLFCTPCIQHAESLGKAALCTRLSCNLCYQVSKYESAGLLRTSSSFLALQS